MADEGQVVTCDLCDRPATQAWRPLKEGEPVKDEDGRLWATWMLDGPPQFGCDDHPVPRDAKDPLTLLEWRCRLMMERVKRERLETIRIESPGAECSQVGSGMVTQ